jgi:hypothetical protein
MQSLYIETPGFQAFFNNFMRNRPALTHGVNALPNFVDNRFFTLNVLLDSLLQQTGFRPVGGVRQEINAVKGFAG